MFEYQMAKGNIKDIKVLPVGSYFDDVRLVVCPYENGRTRENNARIKALVSDGYTDLCSAQPEMYRDLRYMVKPAREVLDHFGKDASLNVKVEGDRVIFSCKMEGSSAGVRHSAVAGVVYDDDLRTFLAGASPEGLVEQAYYSFKKLHPNYDYGKYRSPLPTGRHLSMVTESARQVFIAAAYEIGDKSMLNDAINGAFDTFYLNDISLKFLADKFDIEKRTSKEIASPDMSM